MVIIQFRCLAAEIEKITNPLETVEVVELASPQSREASQTCGQSGETDALGQAA